MVSPQAIPKDWPVQPIDPDDPTAVDVATCGACGLSWDDGRVTSMTPAPSARCPFEQWHEEEPERADYARWDALRGLATPELRALIAVGGPTDAIEAACCIIRERGGRP